MSRAWSHHTCVAQSIVIRGNTRVWWQILSPPTCASATTRMGERPAQRPSTENTLATRFHIYMYIYARNRCARTPPLRRVRLNHTTFATVNPQGLLQWLHTIKTAYTVTQAPRTSSFAGASDFVFCEYEVHPRSPSISELLWLHAYYI